MRVLVGKSLKLAILIGGAGIFCPSFSGTDRIKQPVERKLIDVKCDCDVRPGDISPSTSEKK